MILVTLFMFWGTREIVNIIMQFVGEGTKKKKQLTNLLVANERITMRYMNTASLQRSTEPITASISVFTEDTTPSAGIAVGMVSICDRVEREKNLGHLNIYIYIYLCT